MFENIANFFKKLVKSETKEVPSKDTAKERLHLVLMQDRANVSADFLELMKQEIIEVIKKYIEVEESAIDVRLTNEVGEDGKQGAPSLYANIPILNIKNNVKNESASKSEPEKKADDNKQVEENNRDKQKDNEKEIEQDDNKQKEQDKKKIESNIKEEQENEKPEEKETVKNINNSDKKIETTKRQESANCDEKQPEKEKIRINDIENEKNTEIDKNNTKKAKSTTKNRKK